MRLIEYRNKAIVEIRYFKYYLNTYTRMEFENKDFLWYEIDQYGFTYIKNDNSLEKEYQESRE